MSEARFSPLDIATVETANQARAQELAAHITAMAPDVPEVTLHPVTEPTRGGASLDTYVAVHNGEEVGRAHIFTDRLGRNQSFQGIVVNEGKRGNGYGLGMYRAAITEALGQGHAFKTHEYSQTVGAMRIWQKLGAIGVAHEVEPFSSVDEAGRTTGLSVIMPAPEATSQFRHERNKPLWWDDASKLLRERS